MGEPLMNSFEKAHKKAKRLRIKYPKQTPKHKKSKKSEEVDGSWT